MPDLTVDTTSDVVAMDDGVLSLREALGLADASEGADTIRFADAVQGGTILLAGSELTIASEVTIDGGDGVTIDAGGQSRVLLVQEPDWNAHAWITLAHLTITGGRTRDGQGGAGIYNAARYSALSLDHVTVTGNHAAGSGGGIGGADDVGLSDSTVAGNSAVGGGGGIDGRYVSLTHSTVSDNETRGGSGDGGGIFADRGAYLYHSTVSGNHSGAGLVSDGWTWVTNSTVSGNDVAGIVADGHFYMRNSIVAGNGGDDDRSDVIGEITRSNGANIFGSEVAGIMPSDRQNVAPEVLFAAIDPDTGGGLLADHGGPTPTIALRDAADNPALGRADPDIPFPSAVDQRGMPRPQPVGTNPDIGAFELDQSDPAPPVAATFTVTSAADGIADDGLLTLREALALADADGVTRDRIEFAPDLAGATIRLAGGQLVINSDLVIDGAGVTIDAAGASRVVLVHGLETDVTLQDMTITGGRVTGAYYADGGGVAADFATRLTLDRVAVVGNSSEGSGGGIWGYDVTLINSTVSGNAAAGAGGEIYGNFSFDLLLVNSTVSGNHAARGGGIAAREVTLSNSIVAENGANGAASDIDGIVAASNGHNIFGSEVAGSVAGDLENVPAGLLFAAIDPATGGGLLGNNGGPTQTIALRDAPDNPALGGGDAADAPATDQRGVARPLPGGTDPDIGAFEHPWLSGRADALEYIASYPDLIRALGPDATAGNSHYRHYGAVEGRQVPFDGLEYIASHADLIAALGSDAAAGAVHFIRYGAGEGRVQDDFDAEQYLASHADLQAAFGSDTEAATVHFIRYGHAEGRSDDPLSARTAADFLI